MSSRPSASTVVIYGIRNCDTVKKARRWLDAHGVVYEFHDYKVAGVDPQRLARWCAERGWEVMLNRAGTTYRRLPEADKVGLDCAGAIALMLAQPSMIKRPVLEYGGEMLLGFDPDAYEVALRAVP